MSKIDLTKLNKVQLEKLSVFLDNLMSGVQEEQDTVEIVKIPPKKKKNYKNFKKNQTPVEEVVEENETPKIKPKRGRPSKKSGTNKKGRVQGQWQKMEIVKNRKNLFDTMVDERTGELIKDTSKQDIKIDKKLWGNAKPTPRNPNSGLVDIECSKCGDEHTVNRKVLLKDRDTGNYKFTCNNCIGSN